MKDFLVISVMLLFPLLSCVKENTPVTPIDDRVDTTMAMNRYSGTFGNGPYGSVSGTARIYSIDGGQVLALENFSSSNGPDLHVYISREVQPANFIDLGRLQSVSGNQLYTVPENIDYTIYKYVLIHCQRYNHLFGGAELR